MQLVQDGRQAAAKGQQLSAGAVEADAHGALQGDAAAVAQQRADKRGSWRVRKRAEGGSAAASTGFNFLLYRVFWMITCVSLNGLLSNFFPYLKRTGQ